MNHKGHKSVKMCHWTSTESEHVNNLSALIAINFFVV